MLFLDPTSLGSLANRLLGSLQSYSDALGEASGQKPAAVGSPVAWLLVVLASLLVREETRRQRRNRKMTGNLTKSQDLIANWLP
ncbi:MAG: hypothetical protein U0800_27560 [Isosphaeraceae bacterium]